MLELKCDKLVKILQVLYTLPDLYIIYAKMIRLCPDTIYFSMIDKQLNVIKKYYTDCVLRGLLDCLWGLCAIAMIPYLHSLVYKILKNKVIRRVLQ